MNNENTPSDCNDLTIGTMAYTYPETLNAPTSKYAGWIIFTYGASEAYKVQLAIFTSTGEMKTRGKSHTTGWTSWV